MKQSIQENWSLNADGNMYRTMQKGIEITVNYITNECFKHLLRMSAI